MKWRAVLSVIVAVAVSILIFYLLYLTDNKYTHQSPQADIGILFLDGGTGSPGRDSSLVYLTQGWEFYQYQFLTPEDFVKDRVPAPTGYVFIGQYMGFDMDNNSSSPYGSATYRMNIFTGEDTVKSYTLELPEIFSAYCLWINGELMVQRGNPYPDEYKEELSHGSVTFTAEDRIDIIFSVTNYGHYYSGIVYPPAFGEMRDVDKAMDAAVVVSAQRCFFAIAVGLFYLCVGIFTRDKKAALTFGVLCFLYAGSASHQLVHFVSSERFATWYAVEDFCFYALLAGFALMAAQMFRPQSKCKNAIPIAGLVVGLCVILFPSLSPSAYTLATLSLVVKAYKYIVVGYLLYVLVRSATAGVKYAAVLLVAVSTFGVALAVDMAVRYYEPIMYGWPTEIGGFVMVLALSVIITLDAIGGLKERMILAVKNEQLGVSYELLTQKIEQTKKSSHDLRHHMAVLSGFANSHDIDGIVSYISAYTNNLPATDEIHFSIVPTIDAVARYYYALAKNGGVDININIDLPNTELPEQDLCVLFGNLLENAIEGCKCIQNGHIHFAVRVRGSFITIVCDNSFDGVFYTNDGVIQSRKRNGAGIGTTSVNAIAEKYNGYADFSVDGNEFTASVALHLLEVSGECKK